MVQIVLLSAAKEEAQNGVGLIRAIPHMVQVVRREEGVADDNAEMRGTDAVCNKKSRPERCIGHFTLDSDSDVVRDSDTSR